MSVKKLLVLLIAAFLGYVLWSAHQMQGTVPLVNGYKYWHTGDGVIIRCIPESKGRKERFSRAAERAEREGRLFEGLPGVGPDVDGYRVYDGFIVGHVSNEHCSVPGRLSSAPDTGRPGYFVIDTRNDTVQLGLEKREWLNTLAGYGIQPEPVLFKPSIYDECLGRNKPK